MVSIWLTSRTGWLGTPAGDGRLAELEPWDGSLGITRTIEGEP